MIAAFGPDLPLMPKDDALRDGEPEAKAAAAASCRIGAVEAFEQAGKIVVGDLRTLIGHLQQAAAFSGFSKRHPGGSLLTGIFRGIVQKNIQNLPKLRRITA